VAGADGAEVRRRRLPSQGRQHLRGRLCEAIQLRASDPLRKQHAVQYITLPEFDYDRLRKDVPEEFENPVDASIGPTDWVKLRVVVGGVRIQIYVGAVNEAALDVRKLGQLYGGQVGLWVGNDSGGDFENLVVTPTK
jgi:hypothetical protein